MMCLPINPSVITNLYKQDDIDTFIASRLLDAYMFRCLDVKSNEFAQSSCLSLWLLKHRQHDSRCPPVFMMLIVIKHIIIPCHWNVHPITPLKPEALPSSDSKIEDKSCTHNDNFAHLPLSITLSVNCQKLQMV